MFLRYQKLFFDKEGSGSVQVFLSVALTLIKKGVLLKKVKIVPDAEVM